MKRSLILLLTLTYFISSCTQFNQRRPSSFGPQPNTPSTHEILSKAREALITKGELRKVPKNITESDLVEFLQNKPEWISEDREKLLQALSEEQKTLPDPTKHTRLIPPAGSFGYEDLKIFINHPYYKKNKIQKADNLIEVWKKFILSAKKEIILNVFDFDLEEIASTLVAQAQKGLNVRVGIDLGVIEARSEVKKVANILEAGGVKLTKVKSVGLNHQKITAIDWSDPSSSKVLFSSGNLTRSCLEPEGDLKGTVPLPKESVPNANHLLTMKSWLLANLVEHELTKTLDLKLRGRQYPLNGAYQITGPKVNPETLEAYPEPSLIITFAPSGGMKNINRNIISHILNKETGPIRMLQFAYSSNEVDAALLNRAIKDIEEKKTFDFKSVGDTPFAMRDWSKFLSMSGLKMDKKTKKYSDDLEGIWYKTLAEKHINELRKGIYIAPKIYKDNHVMVNGKNVKVNAKIHHKIISTPNYSILGTSFNFSQGAENNNEQILVIRDSTLHPIVSGMLDHFIKNSPGTVHQESLRRNAFGIEKEETPSIEDRAGQ